MRRGLFVAALVFFILFACTANTPEGTEKISSVTDAGDDMPGEPGMTDGSDISGHIPPEHDFLFEAYGQELYVGMKAAPVLGGLPQPKDIFESPSCAFDGVDITYFYPGFELTTYPKDGQEHILSVIFTDDSITTPEGVYLGGSLSDIEKAYGKDHKQNGNQTIYTRGKGSLIFTLEDDFITGILYMMCMD